jgi:hypothetical protein
MALFLLRRSIPYIAAENASQEKHIGMIFAFNIFLKAKKIAVSLQD